MAMNDGGAAQKLSASDRVESWGVEEFCTVLEFAGIPEKDAFRVTRLLLWLQDLRARAQPAPTMEEG